MIGGTTALTAKPLRKPRKIVAVTYSARSVPTKTITPPTTTTNTTLNPIYAEQ